MTRTRRRPGITGPRKHGGCAPASLNGPARQGAPCRPRMRRCATGLNRQLPQFEFASSPTNDSARGGMAPPPLASWPMTEPAVFKTSARGRWAGWWRGGRVWRAGLSPLPALTGRARAASGACPRRAPRPPPALRSLLRPCRSLGAGHGALSVRGIPAGALR